ncbi:MAG: hypothetical protein NE334_15770 [Lentisphaeraceae bacterium]|nr:hypothetical protein [Lentisphaeraceae bacterium]
MKEKDIWKRLIITCNPWFLSSAVLLLLGIYNVQMDENFISTEESEVLFSFFTLQIYEVMALGSTWYFMKKFFHHDAVLLIIIVSILSLIPYLNLSQAIHLDDQSYSTSIVVSTSFLAILKFVYIKKMLPDVYLPWASLLPLIFAISINSWLPLGFKNLNEDKPLSVSREMMETITKIFIPLLTLSAAIVIGKLKDFKEVYQQKWITITLCFIWLLFSITHLVAIQYVYSISYEAITILVGFLSVGLLLAVPVKAIEYRNFIILVAAICSVFLAETEEVLIGLLLFYCVLAKFWNVHKFIKLFNYAFLSLPILILIFTPNKSYLRCLGLILPLYLAFIFVSETNWTTLFVLCLITCLVSTNRLIHFEMFALTMGTILLFSTLIFDKVFIIKSRVWLFIAFLPWVLYLVSMTSLNPYYFLALGGLYLIGLVIERFSFNCLPRYFYALPAILILSQQTRSVILFVMEGSVGLLILILSFGLFLGGFVMNFRKAKSIPAT